MCSGYFFYFMKLLSLRFRMLWVTEKLYELNDKREECFFLKKKIFQKATAEHHSIQLSAAMGGVKIIKFRKKFFDKMNE